MSEEQKKKEQNYYDLAPGNVLQNMYIKYRLNRYARQPRTFIELGPGNGNISNILLSRGLSGIGYDLNDAACGKNRAKNNEFIKSGMYKIENSDFFNASNTEKVDLIFSSHVLEHLSSEDLELFFIKCKSLLNVGGKIVSLVPSSMKHWGIEDETVGHRLLSLA